jgi:excisionase family DNA binding protein
MHPTEHAETQWTIPERGFATTRQTAEFLGVTRQHVAKLIAEKQIPAKRFGRSWRVPWRWLLEQERCNGGGNGGGGTTPAA